MMLILLCLTTQTPIAGNLTTFCFCFQVSRMELTFSLATSIYALPVIQPVLVQT